MLVWFLRKSSDFSAKYINADFEFMQSAESAFMIGEALLHHFCNGRVEEISSGSILLPVS